MNKSPWYDAIGPLYTVEATAEELRISTEDVRSLVAGKELHAISSSEGEVLIPVGQIHNHEVKPGVAVICTLSDAVDEYSLASWANSPVSTDGETPWEMALNKILMLTNEVRRSKARWAQ